MVRPTDQRMIALKREIVNLIDAKKRVGTSCQRGHVRKQQDENEVDRAGEPMADSLYCGFHRKKDGQGELKGLGLSRLNNFSRLWNIGAIPHFWYLALV